MARDRDAMGRRQRMTIRKHLTDGWTHRFRPCRVGMPPSPSEGSIVRMGTIMGSAILAVSLLNLLPLPPSLQASTMVNSLLAGVGALGGAIAMRPRKGTTAPQ
jgi:hypothetical protein